MTFASIKALTVAMMLVSAACALADETTGTTGASQETFGRPQPTNDYKPSVGVRAGMSDTEGSYNSGLGYGIEVAYQPLYPVTLGIDIGQYNNNSEGNQPALTRSNILAKFAYNLAGNIPVIRYSYLGAYAGMIWDNNANRTDINYGGGPLAGFDIPISAWDSKFSLGAMANFLVISGSKDDVVAFNGVAKYWF